jgi:hypothetical protein
LSDITVRKLEYRWYEHVLNGLCNVSVALGLPPTKFDLGSVEAAARRAAGTDDLGDPRYREPLSVTLSHLEDPKYTGMARAFIKGVAVRALSQRARLEQTYRDNPEILDIPVERPIFVLGWPRTGTTVLQNLLCLEHDRRGLEFSELTRPLQVHPDPAIDRRRRIRSTQREIDFACLLAPEMQKVHYIDATTLEEDWSLFMNTFAVLNFDLAHGMRPVGDWLMDYDMEWPYREYKRMLQLLLHQRPARQLVLKCPEHLWFVPSLLKVFPDACIVWTHRKPFDCVASYSSMITLMRRTMLGAVDPEYVGEHITSRFAEGVTRAMAALDSHDPSSFFHVRFDELIQDQSDMVRRIETYFDLPLTSSEAKVRYLNTPREDKRGAHKYSAARYGLTPEKVNPHFEAYIKRFEIPA